MTLLMFTDLDLNWLYMYMCIFIHMLYHIYNMPFNFITLWKSEMKLKSFINCKSTCIYTITVRRLNNRKWRQRYCLVGERSQALALLNAAQNISPELAVTRKPWRVMSPDAEGFERKWVMFMNANETFLQWWC